jgi:predicted RNase H-like HicB family nuclease
MKYEVIIYWSDEDNAFIAEVPGLPGCMADGPTKAKALTSGKPVNCRWSEPNILWTSAAPED